MSKPDVLDVLAKGRHGFTTEEWRHFLLRSVGLEPGELDDAAQKVVLLRMVPFVERNFNLVELGPRGTGKSHIYQQVSPYSHLVSGGKATVAKMFVNNATGQRGLVCQYDVVCFDEVSGVSFDSKDGVNILKGYMESGEFSRGKESIRAEGGVVMVGNFDVDVQQQQRIGHLLSPLPSEMRDDTAFHDRIHAFAPGWDFPKLNPNEHLTDHFGLVSDFLSECWSRMRSTSRVSVLQNRVYWGGALSGRDINAVQKTISGLSKLLFPDPDMPIADEEMEWMVRLALEARRRVKEQQKRCLKSEFRNTHFSYTLGVDGVENFVATPELHSDEAIDGDPLPPGQVWAIGPGTSETGAGLHRIEATVGPGSGAKILNHPQPPAFRESVKVGEQNLYTRGKLLVGDRNPRDHQYSIQLRPFDSDKTGAGLGLPVLVALVGSLLERSTRGATILVGPLNLGGSMELIQNPVDMVELAVDKHATTILMPVGARRALNDLPDEVWTKINIEFYSDPEDGVFKALIE
jgi:ATP-dependent Lon protease